MKKLLTILMILVFITPIFAGVSGTIGITSGYKMAMQSEDLEAFNTTYNIKQTIHSVPVSVKGNLLFGKKDLKLGLDYGVKFVNFPLKAVVSTENGNSTQDISDEEASLFFAPQVGFALEYNISDNFALTTSAGLEATFKTDTLVKGDKIPIDCTISTTVLSLYATAGMAFNIKPVTIIAGVDLSVPVYANANVKINSEIGTGSKDSDYDISGFIFSPYVGLGFKF